ncbi:MAG: imidazole glycerol phosphate synthase subunit HisH [Clostridia bacterium]|nr:imidazole glycerol phosphate synthase subunit HisH [Clostridia bacterium]
MAVIGIIDYGMGNLHSVKNALDFLEIDNFISSDKEKLAASDALILPGVGAFPDAMESLQRDGLVDFIHEQTKTKKLLGICLGMQLLLEKSYEVRECEGLGLIPGEVIRITAPGLKIPHMGWNDLRFPRETPLTAGLSEGDFVYFVHSFRAELACEEDLAAYAEYGERIPAIIGSRNVWGAQFHPEKSERVGLQILRNFGGMIE